MARADRRWPRINTEGVSFPPVAYTAGSASPHAARVNPAVRTAIALSTPAKRDLALLPYRPEDP